MSNYKLEFTLKQHTPIIHFQHDQAGATLRATEVKPKLDRFILTKLGEGDYKKGIEIARKNNWLVGKGEHPALDYKVRIEMPKFNESLLERKRNVKIITEAEENTLLYRGDILLNIICFNKTVIEKIDELLEEFFIITSFGKRQNKGFGCFYKKDSNFDNDVKPILKLYNWYLLNNSPNNLLTFNNGFGKNYEFYILISKKWRVLKSGFNHNGYIKSSIFKYLCNNGLRWDKRWIKKELKPLLDHGEHLVSTRRNNRFNEPNDCGGSNYNCNNQPDYQSWSNNTHFTGDYRFGRAMLGLAEHYEFRSDRRRVLQVQVKSNNGVERYKAPVTFKVFDNNVFAIAQEQLLFNESFYFEVKVKQDGSPDQTWNFHDNNGNNKTLNTPSGNEWDLVSFLDIFFPCINFIKQ